MTIIAKALFFLLLTGCFNTVFTNARERSGVNDQNQDPVPGDTLQSLLNEYSRKVSARTACMKKLDSLNSILDENKGKQEGLTEEKKAYQLKKDSLNKKTAKEKKIDTVRSQINYYDSLVDDTIIRIVGNEKARR